MAPTLGNVRYKLGPLSSSQRTRAGVPIMTYLFAGKLDLAVTLRK
jgi:hypothetical protein